MSPEVIAVVLLAALLHAAWNAAAKSLGNADPMVTTSAIAIGGALVAMPLLACTGLPAAQSHPHVVASGIIHVVYFVLVGLAYRSADYSAVYPITRGSAPLATALLAGPLLGETIAPLGWAGIGLLAAGILGLGSDALRRGGLDRSSLSIAALNVAVIVAYTLIDGAGTRAAGDAAAYVLAMMALTGLLLLPLVWLRMGRTALVAMATHWRLGLLGGAMVTLSYGTALWAMTKAPVGMVAALRETSVLFAAVIGAVVLKERFGVGRWLGAALILAGLVAMRGA